MVIALLGAPAPGLAESETDASIGSEQALISVDEIALELSNPATRLRSITLDMEYTTYQGDLPGADDQHELTNIFTLSWPIELANGNNLMLRATLPHLTDQPYWKPVWYLDYADFIIRQLPDLDPAVGGFGSGHDHLGTIGLDISYGRTNDNGFFSSLGIATIAPTSEDQSATRGQWLLGPEIALAQFTNWGLFGVRAKHLTNIYGEGDQELGELTANETTVKLSFSYALGNGWLIESNPVIFYDWEAVSGNEWMVPVGAGLSKTFRIGRMPMKLGFELHHYVVSPDRFGPEWLFKFHLAPVLSTRLMR
jgi:hypothetical protein